MLELLNKSDHIAVFITGPTPEALSLRVHLKRRPVIVVKGTEADVQPARGAQWQPLAYHGYDVVGFFDSLGLIVVQGPPVMLRARREKS
jgi:hypothetical protein